MDCSPSQQVVKINLMPCSFDRCYQYMYLMQNENILLSFYTDSTADGIVIS